MTAKQIHIVYPWKIFTTWPSFHYLL